jgi:hypothetical protein
MKFISGKNQNTTVNKMEHIDPIHMKKIFLTPLCPEEEYRYFEKQLFQRYQSISHRKLEALG